MTLDGDACSFAAFGPKLFLLSFAVVYNDSVCSVKDVSCTSIVSLQLVFLSFRKILLKVQNVLVVGSSPGIDGLVVISDNSNISVFHGDHGDQLVLKKGSVLELVHHYVSIPVLDLFQDIWPFLEYGDGEKDKVVEVYHVVGLLGQKPFVVDVPYSCAFFRQGHATCLVGGEELSQGTCVVVTKLEATSDDAVTYQGYIVILVIEGEIISISQVLDILLQKSQSKGMEGGGCKALQLLSCGFPDSICHFLGSFVGEGQGKYLAFVYALIKHVGNTVCDHPCLAASGSCNDELRPLYLRGRQALFWIQKF